MAAARRSLDHETVRAAVGPGTALGLTARFAGGSFRTGPAGLHTTTNAAVIERFLPVRFEMGEVVRVR